MLINLNRYYANSFYICLSTLNYTIMIKIQVRFVGRGDYVHLKDDENSPIWIRNHYDRASKRYSLTSYEDANHEIFCCATSYVYIEEF